MYIGSVLVFMLLKKQPRFTPYCNLLGPILMACGLVAASFATTAWHLLLTQGVLYGLGGTLMYPACILYLEEWFVAKKGLAFGIMWAGTPTGCVSSHALTIPHRRALALVGSYCHLLCNHPSIDLVSGRSSEPWAWSLSVNSQPPLIHD